MLIAAGLILCAVGWWITPGWWRSGLVGDVFFPDHVNRAHLPLTAFMSCLVLALSLTTAEDRGYVSQKSTTVLLVLVAVVMTLSLVTFSTVVLFNRPAFLVPPRMRRQRGAISRRGPG